MHVIAKWLEGPSCMAIFLNPQLHLGLPDVTHARLCHCGVLFLDPESLSFPCSLFKKTKSFSYLLAVLGLCCCGAFSLVAASGGYSLVAVCGLLTAVTSPVVEFGL